MQKFILAAIVLTSASAMALTLKEQKEYLTWQTYLNDTDQSYAKQVKNKCGYEIPISLGEEFVVPFVKAERDASSYCDSTREAISDMCEDETTKTFIKRNIKKIECKLGKEKEIAFKLANGTFTFTVGVDAVNLQKNITKYLENNLK